MSAQDPGKYLQSLQEGLVECGNRIRRYSMDPFVRVPDQPEAADPGRELREELDKIWAEWARLRTAIRQVEATPNAAALGAFDDELEQLVRRIDKVQRELISDSSYDSGRKTVLWLSAVLLALLVTYVGTHGVFHGYFEPWGEWGPAKYGEVAFWSTFGCLCSLLYRATHYLARRDYDKWFNPWYVSTLLRAPFLTVILMLVLLEFAETLGPDSMINDYLLEEGNKFYFIAFASFCLGLSSDTTNGIIRELSAGVTELFCRLVSRFSNKLASLVKKEG